MIGLSGTRDFKWCSYAIGCSGTASAIETVVPDFGHSRFAEQDLLLDKDELLVTFSVS